MRYFGAVIFALLVFISFAFVPPLQRNPRPSTALNLEVFGLGPTELVVILATGVLLFGPDRVKSQLREQGVKGGIVSSSWRAESLDRIDAMRTYASKRRKDRSWDRINEAIESGDEEMALRLVDIADEDSADNKMS